MSSQEKNFKSSKKNDTLEWSTMSRTIYDLWLLDGKRPTEIHRIHCFQYSGFYPVYNILNMSGK